MAGTTTNSGWAVETSLDVEWAHAIAPDANILLVEAKSNSLTDLMNAVTYATTPTRSSGGLNELGQQRILHRKLL